MLDTDDSKFLPPLNSDEFLPPIGRWTSLGGFVLVGAVGIAIILTAVIKYNVTVRATATIRPAGELRIVQPQMEGTVQRIQVQENQRVKRGDAIAFLDNSRLETQNSQLRGKVQQGKLQLEQIDAQAKALEAQMGAESKLLERTISSAQAELSRNQRDYTERTISTQAEFQEVEAALELTKDEMSRYQELVKSGAVSVIQFKEKQAAVKSAEARRERAKAALNPTAATVAIAREQIAQERAKGEATLAALKKEREALIQRRAELQNQLNHDQKELQYTQRELQNSVIRATSDGTILTLNLRNPGQVVHPGDAIAQIAPSNVPLAIEARVSTQDINQVAIGQKAQLRILACPYPDYGTLTGVVSAISPDALTPPAHSAGVTTLATATPQPLGTSSSASYFQVTIQPNHLFLAKGDRQCPIKPGMQANADIISKDETVFRFILRKARLLTDL